MASVIEVNIEVALREGDEVAVAEPFRVIQNREDLRYNAEQDYSARGRLARQPLQISIPYDRRR